MIHIIDQVRSQDIFYYFVIEKCVHKSCIHNLLHIVIDFSLHFIQSYFFAKMFFLLSVFHEKYKVKKLKKMGISYVAYMKFMIDFKPSQEESTIDNYEF